MRLGHNRHGLPPDANSDPNSRLPASAVGAARAIWVVGAQKVVADLGTALRRVEEHALALETARAQAVYGRPSAVNRLLVPNAEPQTGRGTVDALPCAGAAG